jgi:type II secretory pathway pseudopilin PulG
MDAFGHRVRARVRARRAAAWAGSETGDTMIEVVIAILIVGLIGAATFTGFTAITKFSGQQRHEVQANQIAQQDEERLRGLTSTELSATAGTTGSTGSTYGNVTYPVTLDGETYTVSSTTRFVAASGGATSCTSGGTSTADYVETASEVQWPNNNDGRPPVIEHSVISPPAGGSLIVEAELNNTTTGIPGVAVTATGPGSSSNTQTLTTDANGCAVFGGLNPGSYSISESNSGYATENGVTTQSAIVVNGTTQEITFQLGQLGTAVASFQTFINSLTPTAINWDSFSISNPQVTPSSQTFGTGGAADTSTVSSTAATVFPTSYNAYAGTCSTDDPEGSTGTTGTTSYIDPVLTVANGATGSVVVTVPTMLLKLSTQQGSTAAQGVTAAAGTPLPYTVTTYDSCTPTPGVNNTPSTPPNSLTVGSSTVYPVQAPYGPSVQVCFANTIAGTTKDTGILPSSGAISNTNLNGTTITPVTLPVGTGATGASAVFLNPGGCPA